MELMIVTNCQKNRGEEEMDISRRHNLSRTCRLALILLTLAILGTLVTQGCTLSAPNTGTGGQENTATTGTNGSLAPAPKIGRLAPDFTLFDLNGNQIRLSDIRGRTVFINFWTTWCPPCRAEMPEMEAIYQKYKDKGVVVIGVDILEAEDEVRQYVQQGGYSWTFILDTTGEVAKTYELTAIPTSFFIDKEGIIRAVNIGTMTKRAMEVELTNTIR